MAWGWLHEGCEQTHYIFAQLPRVAALPFSTLREYDLYAKPLNRRSDRMRSGI